MKSTLFLTLLGLSLLSCQREVRQNSFGTSTTPLAIELAQIESIGKLNPYQAKQGQLVHFLETQEVVTSQAPIKSRSKEWTVELNSIKNFDDDRVITTRKKVTDFIYDEKFIYEFKSVYAFEEIEKLDLLDQLDLKRFRMSSILSQLKEKSNIEESEIDGVSFHNLRKSTVVLTPPKKVKDAKDCKNLKDCRINADKITYDIVFLLTDGSTQTHNIEWFISPDVPFFASILKQCATTVIPIESLRVLVKQCNEVVDFNE